MRSILFKLFMSMAMIFMGLSLQAQIIPFAYWNSSTSSSCSSGGYSYSGNCYYLGAAGADCFSTCSSYGGCLKTATATLAESSTACKAAIKAMGLNPSGASSGSSITYACAGTSSTYYYNTAGSIQCGATSSGVQRACACGTGGTTQAGAATVNGYNFVLGAAGDSCDTTCTSYGGCNLTGTTYAAGSSSTCATILSDLDQAPTGTASGSNAVGCGYESSVYTYLGSLTTTCAATLSGVQRVCACVNSP